MNDFIRDWRGPALFIIVVGGLLFWVVSYAMSSINEGIERHQRSNLEISLVCSDELKLSPHESGIYYREGAWRNSISTYTPKPGEACKLIRNY